MMETFDLLLANSDRRVSNLIESLVRDVCRGDAIVNCTRVTRVDETLGEALETEFDLIIINPENLAAAPGRPSAFASMTEATSALRGIKSFRTAPIIALAVSAQHEMLFSQAGADLVLGLPFNCEDLKSAVRRLSTIPKETPALAPMNISFTMTLKSKLQNLVSAMALTKPILLGPAK